MENKSKFNSPEVAENVTSITEVEIEEDSEEVIVTEETLDSEAEMIEDLEEILVTDPEAASTVVKKVTLPETAQNVLFSINVSEKTKRFPSKRPKRQRQR